ncbi:MAG TPA: hypothetical protein VK797_02025 [Tepidisphaeraceae bacterium]|jgi:hypothetical protein|nr:hypothetical protein [Tepidisphaeraceae bacterium]
MFSKDYRKRFCLLKVYEQFVQPRVRLAGGSNRIQRKPRLIGPGPALKNEHERFLKLYERHRAVGEDRRKIA